MEAHNFSLQASITTIHTQNEKKQDAMLIASARTLTKSVFSIGTLTLKVMEDNMDESKEEDNSKEERPKNNEQRVAIKGMEMLSGKKSKAMLLETGKEEDKLDEEGSNKWEFEDSDNKMKRAAADLSKRMEEVSALLPLDSEEDKDSYNTPAS